MSVVLAFSNRLPLSPLSAVKKSPRRTKKGNEDEMAREKFYDDIRSLATLF
jgi:hypothetical protein